MDKDIKLVIFDTKIEICFVSCEISLNHIRNLFNCFNILFNFLYGEKINLIKKIVLIHKNNTKIDFLESSILFSDNKQSAIKLFQTQQSLIKIHNNLLKNLDFAFFLSSFKSNLNAYCVCKEFVEETNVYRIFEGAFKLFLKNKDFNTLYYQKQSKITLKQKIQFTSLFLNEKQQKKDYEAIYNNSLCRSLLHDDMKKFFRNLSKFDDEFLNNIAQQRNDYTHWNEVAQNVLNKRNENYRKLILLTLNAICYLLNIDLVCIRNFSCFLKTKNIASC
jgi:hypothetical protein